MKKISLLIAVLTFAAACATPPTNRDLTSSNRGVAEATPTPMTEADAIAKEKAIWDTIKRKDYDAFAAMLDAGSLEVVPEGVIPKEGSVSSIKDFEPTEVNFSDWKYVSIDKDAFIVTYVVSVKGKYRGKDLPDNKARASSAWAHHQGKWLAVYHQECPVKPPPTPPPAPKSTPAAAASSPAASPAAASATGSDPIANEKIVWDLFKSKNYDAFATLLAPEFTEVEPDGVYDRAGTIKGVQTFDASKAVLSDWKAANINDDAALVTYSVKGPGPPWDPMGERHATIWVKRDGKWLGIFHQGGTGIRPAPKPTPTPKTTVSPVSSK